MKLVIFDLETTGLSPSRDSIIQIAAMKLNLGTWEQAELFSTFVQTQKRIPAHITRLTNITDEQVRSAPPPEEALLSFSRYIGEDTTLVAHCGPRFDLPFVRESCARHGIATRQAGCIDSRGFSKQIWGGRGGHDLDTIASRLQINPSKFQRHDARGDVQLLAEALRLMWDRTVSANGACPLMPVEGVIPQIG
jgi:DNA polymerase III alpha subunit (gram-positive type)